MNIFWLDLHPRKSALYACDQHVNKMITENTQVICTVLRALGYPRQPMKSVGMNKRLTQWVYEDFANFAYLADMTYFYYQEYQRRYQKTWHKGWHGLQKAITKAGGMNAIRKRFREHGRDNNRSARYVNTSANEKLWSCITVPPMYVPEEYQVRVSERASRERKLQAVVKSYRRFYQESKSSFARYYHSEPPRFMRGRCATEPKKRK